MANLWTALIWLASSATAIKLLNETANPGDLDDRVGVANYNVPDAIANFDTHNPFLDADCSGNDTCVDMAAEIKQSLSTTELRRMSAEEVDSLVNDGFVFLPRVLTNRKLVESLGRQIAKFTTEDTTVQHHLLNSHPAVRALTDDKNLGSLLDSLKNEESAGRWPWRSPKIFKFEAGSHHNLDDLHFNYKPPWGNGIFHQDAWNENLESQAKFPANLTLWIAMSHSTEPFAIFRGSHYTWPSFFTKCSGYHHCWDFQCVEDHLGAQKLWSTNVEPGDMILFNAAAIHGGIEQETERTALTIRAYL